MQLCLCLPVHHHGCMPSYVWPFQKCVDMFRNKLCDVKITYWVGNKQICPKRTGPLKAMGSSCWGLDLCSALAAAAGILLLLCLRDLSGAYPCRIEEPCVCSPAYPHLTSGGCVGGKWEGGNEHPFHSSRLRESEWLPSCEAAAAAGRPLSPEPWHGASPQDHLPR